MVQGIKITVEPVELTKKDIDELRLSQLPDDLKAKAIELSTLLKMNHGVDIWADDMQFIGQMFSDVFRPLMLTFQNGGRNEKEIADAYKEYRKRWTQLTSVFMYARDRYGVDMSSTPYDDMIIAKITEIADTVNTMHDAGKSLDEAYRYIVKLRSSFVEPEQGKVN